MICQTSEETDNIFDANWLQQNMRAIQKFLQSLLKKKNKRKIILNLHNAEAFLFTVDTNVTQQTPLKEDHDQLINANLIVRTQPMDTKFTWPIDTYLNENSRKMEQGFHHRQFLQYHAINNKQLRKST